MQFSSRKVAVLSSLLLLLGTFFAFPVSPSHGQLVGTVCLIPSGATSCPSTPASLTGAVGTQLRVSVFIQGSDAMNGFDVTVLANHTILKPAGADITGTVLPSPASILVECIGGVLVLGNTCATTDTPDTIHLAAIGAPGQLTTAPTTGLLFTAIYNVTGTGSIPVGYQTGCSSSSVSGTTTCVTIANGSASPVPEMVQTANFSNTGPDFAISASNPSMILMRGSSGTSNIILTSQNGFTGTINLSTSVSPSTRKAPSATLSSTSVTLSSGGTSTVVLTITAGRVGSFTVTVTGTSGSLTHSTSVSITVTR